MDTRKPCLLCLDAELPLFERFSPRPRRSDMWFFLYSHSVPYKFYSVCFFQWRRVAVRFERPKLRIVWCCSIGAQLAYLLLYCALGIRKADSDWYIPHWITNHDDRNCAGCRNVLNSSSGRAAHALRSPLLGSFFVPALRPPNDRPDHPPSKHPLRRHLGISQP